MKIRKVEIKDIDRIIEMEFESFGESLGYEMIFREITTNSLSKYLLIEVENKVIGYIGSWINDKVCEIINFLISPMFQEKGYAKLLLSDFLSQVKKEGISYVFLDVKETNIKAINLYNKYGFKYSRTRYNYYSDGKDALVLMKELI